MITVRGPTGEETLPLEEFERRVRTGQVQPSTPVRFEVLTGEEWVSARELEVFRRLYAPARIHFTRAFSLGRFPVFTTLLCVLQIGIYFYVAGWERVVSLDDLVAAGAKWRPNVLELGETWRLLSANLLHRDVLHLFFNMFFLFNVGGTIENAYRLRDYALILIVSGLATTTVSTLLSTVPSVGASGMVLGLFGSASVFGYKYADILPPRYRRYFGGAVLPYAIFILYVGLASPDTDNWGHLGGLVGGLLVTLPMQPRLLYIGRPRPRWVVAWAPLIAGVALIAATLAAGPALRALGPRMEGVVETESGIAFSHPAGWYFGENHLGFAARGNALGASIGVRAEQRTVAPVRLEDLERRLLEALARRERDGDITAVRVLGKRPFLLDGGRAAELTVALESRAGPQITRNVLIERGYYGYQVVLSAPRVWAEAYAPLFDDMRAAIRLVEPAPLARAREVVRVFPGMSSAFVDLGDQLAAVGEVEAAEAAYRRALEALAEHPEAEYGLAKLALDYDGDLDAAERLATELYERRPDAPAFAALLADIRQRLGQLEGACAVLQATLDQLSTPPEDLRERLTTLGCRAP